MKVVIYIFLLAASLFPLNILSTDLEWAPKCEKFKWSSMLVPSEETLLAVKENEILAFSQGPQENVRELSNVTPYIRTYFYITHSWCHWSFYVDFLPKDSALIHFPFSFAILQYFKNPSLYKGSIFPSPTLKFWGKRGFYLSVHFWRTLLVY